MPGIALFDLDKTLTRRGTWSRFVRFASPNKLKFWAVLPLIGWQALIYKLGLASRASVKIASIHYLLKGRSRADLAARAKEFIALEISTGLRRHTLERIEAHRLAGDRLIIASAAVDLICDEVARALSFEGVISTKLAWDRQDRLRADLEGENCYGAEKLARIKAYFDHQRPEGVIYFYSDHHTDMPSLLWADQGIAVNPSPPLRHLAKVHNLTIQDWEKAS